MFKRFLSQRANSARKQILLQNLEDRVMFSATPAGELLEASVAAMSEDISSRASDDVRTDHFAFVDQGIENFQLIVDELRAQGGSDLEVIVLDEARDGVVQIQEALDGRTNVGSIQLFSHGEDGQLFLGNAKLNSASMRGIHRESLETLAGSLREGADFLIFGCDFAKGDVGRDALQRLATLTGADVAASDDVTGHQLLNGDWDLEVHTGDITAEATLSLGFQQHTFLALGPVAQEFYVPFSEQGIYDANEKILNEGAFGAVSRDTITVVGFTVNQDDTTIVYDHHEDGYEADLDNPVQATTEIWGDGDLSNGVAPGFASDLLTAGDIVLLQNTIDTTITPDVTFDFDGGDRFGADRGIAVTRAGWSDFPGTVLAGTVEVADTSRWGTQYESPVGEDTPLNAVYEYVGLFVQAAVDNTTVAVDADADGTADFNFVLQQGEIRHIDGGIRQGATVDADQIVQVDLLTGDRDSGVDSRWYMLRPRTTWSSEYLNPVTTTNAAGPGSIVIYNPHTTSLDVDIESQTGTTTVTIAGGGTQVHTLPLDATPSGQFVSSQDGRDFYAAFAMDTDATHTTYDWGFSLLPTTALTEMAFAGWAPGSLDLSGNGSPIWVTANQATTLFVDFDGDPSTGAQTDPFGNQYDTQISLARLESVQLYDSVNADNDQTGLRVYSVDGTELAVAWGIDPATAGPGNPFLDMGTVVLPTPVPDVEKSATVSNDVDGNGVADPGDTITWTISITNLDVNPMVSVVAVDNLPANTTYVANSATLDGLPFADDTVGLTLMPFDEGGGALPDIAPQSTLTITFDTRLNDFPVVYNQVVNTVFVQSDQFTTGDTETLPINTTPLRLEKSITSISDASSGTAGNIDVTYSMLVENVDVIDLQNLSLIDNWSSQMGANFVGVLPGSVSVVNIDATTAPTANATYSGGGAESMVSGGLLASGQSFRVNVTVELDPDADPAFHVNDRIVNQASVTGEDTVTSTVFSDLSDDPTDTTNIDLEADNEADDPTTLTVSDIEIQKTTGTITAASSGTDGNFDVEYVFTVTNTGLAPLTNLSVVDDWATQFGGNFIGIVAGSVAVTDINASTLPGANGSYSGGGTENMLDGTGLLRSGESFQIALRVEVDPDADPSSLNAGRLFNQATVRANDSSGVVTDLSDDPTDSTNADTDGDNDPDDTTAVSLPAISLTKAISSVVVASSGTVGNVDVTYDFVVSNPGSAPLSNLTIVDDWLGQLGGAFVGVVPGTVAVSNVDATTVPGANAAYAGGAVQNMLDGTGLLEAGQSFQVSVTIEVDPDNATANYQPDGSLENLATASGQDPVGTTVTDTSDDPTDATNTDPDNDNNPDDATKLLLADLVTVKTLASGDATPDEGDTVTYLVTVTNNGAAQATNVSLSDTLPAGLSATVSHGAISQGSYNAATGLWSVGTLSSGASATLMLEGTVDAGQGGNTITNVTTAASGDQDDPTTTGDDLTEAVTVNNDANLTTVKTLASGDATPDEGDTVTFLITVTNNGAAQTSNVSLTDSLPTGFTATGGNGAISQGTYNAATGLWTIGTLNTGASATLVLEGTVDAGQGGNTITNVTTAAVGDQNDPTTIGDDLTEAVTVNNDANLTTVKTLASGDATPDEGDTVTFLITVTNNGAAQTTNVSLTDALPAGFTATGGNGAISQGTYNATTGLWTIGTLNTGASATLVLEGTVDAGQGGNTITNVTTAAAGDQNDPTTIGDDLTEAVTANNDANLTTVKTLASGDATPDEGDTVTFLITVTNNGAAQTTNVSLTDALPAGFSATGGNGAISQGTYNAATGLWTIGTLNTGASATLTLEGTVDAGQGGNTLTNVTTAATGDQNDPTTIGDDLTESVTVSNDANLVTVKTLASGDATPDEGDTVNFLITVSNNGAAQATNVSLTDALPTGFTATGGNGAISQGTYNAATGLWTIGTLNTGASATLTLEGTVDAGQGGNTITNVTTAAAGDQNDPTTIGDDLTEAVTVNNDANLTTVKTLASGDATPDEGDTVNFLITVSNNGAAQATNVSLTDALPTGFTATGGNGAISQGTYNAATGLWTIGTLNTGASATLTLEGTVDAGQGGNTITNVTTAAAGDQNDPTTIGDDLTEAVTVNNDANLTTVKTLASGDATPDEGDTVNFLITVTNNGAAQATNVSLTDALPTGFTATGGNGAISQGTYNAATGLWTIGTLNTGASATLVLEGTVDAGQGGNTITNVTTAAVGDQNDPTTIGDDLTEAVTVNNDANLTTVKTLASGDATPDEGDTVTFLITVTNNGAAQTTNVSLTDALPAGFTATAGNGATSQGTYNAATGLWTIGTLNTGSSATLTLEGTVDTGQSGNTLTNTTTAATGDQNDPTTIGDDLTESVSIDNDADLVTVKTLASGDATPDEGDTVTFLITVTNNGAAQATNVSLTDALPTGFTATGGNGAVSQGTYNAATGLWTIGALNTAASATLTLEGTVDAGQGGNTITNITTAAAGDQNDPTTIGDDLTEAVTVNNDANLVTVKTLASGDATPDEGDTVTFLITVTNNGAAQTTNVSLTDALPSGLTATVTNGGVSQGTYNAATGLWTIGTLNTGASATLTLEGTVDTGQSGNTITNVTTAATGDQNDPTTIGDDLTESVSIDNDADLVTVKTLASGDATPDEGDTVTFLITVTNNGAAQATNVSLTDALPTGFTATGGNGAVSQGTYNAATGLWTIGALNTAASATLTLEGTVDAGQGGNTITNITTAAAGDQNDPTTIGDDLTEAVTVNNDANLVTVKTLASGDATPDEGDVVTFLITVTNNGAAQTTNVSLTDSLPTGFTATGGNGAISQGTYNAATGLWTIGTLSTGASATLILEGTVDAGQGGNTITNVTTAAAGDQNDPTTIGDDLTEAVTVNNDANLTTVKTLASGDATPDEGDTVTFLITVSNNGAAQTTNVSLTDSLPTGFTATGGNGATSQGTYNAATGLWTIGTLNTGASATLILEGTVDAGQGGNTITNVTTAAAGDQNDPTTIGDDLTEAVTVNNDANLTTVKTLASGDATPDEGDTVTFLITVTNNGAAQTTNVSLTDALPAGFTATAGNGTISQGTYNAATGLWTIGTLDTGASATLTLEGTVDVGQGGNTITNITTAATGDQNDPTTIGDDLTESVTVNNDANLVTVKTLASGDATPDEGDTVTFLITVTNNGAAQTTNVSLTDNLPSGLTATVTNGSVSQGTYNAATGLWTIGTLNSGASATLTLEGTVDTGQSGNTITNVTTAATGDQNDPTTIGDDLTESVSIDNDADLVTVKTLASGDATPDEGDTVTFLITVTNNGAAQATNVSLTDALPTGFTATGGNGAVSQGTYNAATGLWTIGALNTAASATLTLEGTVDAGQGGNTITNITTAAAGDQNDPTTIGDDLTEAVTVNNDANLVTVKTLASGDATPDEGDVVTFLITVTNNGAAQTTNVSLTDSLPTGFTATGGNGAISQGTYNAATGLWTIGTLSTGASATLTLEGTVDAGQGGNTITNITTAAVGDQNDPTTIGDDLTEAITVNNDANLVTVKTLASGDATPDEGDTVTFLITVTNNGAAQTTNVSLTDSLPTGFTATGGNGAISQGTYNAATGLWNIGTLNTGASATLTLEGIVDAGQGGNTITNITTAAAGDQNDPTTAGDDLTEAVTVNNDTNLVTVKTLASGDATPDEGDTVTFQIQVTNNGAAQATNVSLTDSLPTGFTATAGNGTASQGAYSAATGLWTIGTLNTGASATLTLEGTVDAGQGGNTITNITTAAAGDQNDPTTIGDDLTEAVTVNNDANLVTVKTLASGNAAPDEGDTVTFLITVTNNGAAQTTNVTLVDLLPTEFTPTGANGIASQGAYNNTTGLWSIGTLNVGASATLSLEGTVNAGQGGNTITNITTAATADQNDPTTIGDDLTEAVTINNDANLVTVKTLASGDVAPDEGDTVTFLITVTNNGAAQATNVSLTDLLPSGLTAALGNGAISQGTYNGATGLWSIGTLSTGAVATLTLEGTVDTGQGGNTITNTTTAATGDQNDPTTAGDDLTETITPVSNADLVTVKTLASADPTPNEGDTVTFLITVTNNGTAQATNVSLTDALPTGFTATAGSGVASQGTYNATTGLWSIGTLNNGSSATLTLEGTVDVGQGGNTITNVTTAAAGDQNDPSTAGDDLTEAVVVANDANLVTVKTLASGNSSPAEGDTVTFLITVTNNGAAQATNVSLTDLLPSELTATASNGTASQGTYNATTGLWSIGTLNNGSSATLSLEGTVNVGQGGSTITNVTTPASGDQNDPTTAGDDYLESINAPNDANLVTVKTLASGDSTPDEGDTVTFLITVTNNGAAQATNVALSDLLPTGLTATAGNGVTSQGTYNAVTGLWSLGTLNNGTSATLLLEGSVDVGQGGNTITNVTTAAAGDQTDPTTVGDDLDESINVANDADLVTVKTLISGDATPDEGDTVTFQIQVTNNGAAQATNVSLTDLLPGGLTATAGNGSASQGTYSAVSGAWSIGTLNSGASATLILEGTVDVGQGGNTLTNFTTAATGDQNDPSTAGDDLDESVSVANDANLVTVKTLASGDATPDEGDTVTFLITVTNNGAAQATNVSLTDLLPAGLTGTAANGGSSQGTYNNVTGLWSIGTLDRGTSATLTLEGTVDVGQGGNTVTNITTAASGDQNDPDTVGDDLTEAVVVNNDASLVTVKTLASGDATPEEGDTVTFQIEVTNSGAAQATNISLTDLLPTGLTPTLNNGTASQGVYNSTTGLWTIGTLANGANATLTLEGVVDAGQGGNTLTNITTAASGDQNDPDTIGDDLEESVTVVNDADLVTVKTLLSGNSSPVEGEVVTFQIQVTNNGAAQATNVSLTDLLPTELTATLNNGTVTQGTYNATTGLWSIGTMDNGSLATLVLEGTVNVGQGGNSITNITTAATGDQNDPTTAGDDLTESINAPNEADLVTIKTLASGDATPEEGDTVSFQIQVTNNGAAQATNVSLTDLLPTGLTATANNGQLSQGTYNATTGLWTVGTINVGASATLTLEGTVNVGEGGNTILNVTTAAVGDQNDPTTAGDDLEEQVSVPNNADLVTVKTLASGNATPDEGDVVTFVITVTNNGAAQATNVSLSDSLPAGFTATAGNGTVSQGAYNETTGLWSLGTLNTGQSATLSLEGTVDVGQGGNVLTNVTTAATGDQNDPTTVGDDLDETVTVANDADLVTVKTLLSGNATPDEGEIVSFQIQITNNGAAQATNVSLTDLLPVGISATGGNGAVSQGTYNSTTGLWSVGTLDQGASATLTLQGIVDVGQGGNSITNTTTAAVGDQNDPTTVGDDLDETVVVANDADLVTVKTLLSGDATPDEGDTVTFQIQVTNNGVARATNVSLTDLLPAGLTPTAGNGTASQGTYNAATGVWSIGTLDQGGSAVITLEGTVDAGQGGNTIVNVTTAATGDQNDPTTVGDDLDESIVVNNDATLVTVKTLLSGNANPDEGDVVSFLITVTNNGAARATNVSLTDLLPAGLTPTAGNGVASQGTYNAVSGIWNAGTIDSGASATLVLEGTVDIGQGSNTITNVTTAAVGDQNDPDTIGDDLDESITVRGADLVTVKTLLSGTATPAEGDVVTFQIEVINNGGAQASNVALNDFLPIGLTATAANGTVSQGTYSSGLGVWAIGTLNNGASATLILEGTVDVGQSGNTITNVTTAARADQDDPTTAGDDLTETVTVSNDASLVTVKTLLSGNATPAEGDTVTFQIEVTNNGGANATNVTLSDLLPAGLMPTTGNGVASQGTYNATTGLWNVGAISVGGSATLVLEGTVDVGQGGNTITNVTTAAIGDQDDPDTIGDDLDETVVVANDADLVTVKTLLSADATPAEGDVVQFQIEVTNNGAAQATNVSLVDLLPTGITATPGNGVVSQGTYNAATGLWSIGILDQGNAATLVLEGTVDAGQATNTLTNVTTAATGDQNDATTVGDDLDEAVIVANETNLVTVKTLLSGDTTPDEGDTVAFQIEVTNAGPITATNVVLTDLLPPGMLPTLNNGTVSQGTYNDTTGQWNIGTLADGASATLTLEGIVAPGQGGQSIANVTTAATGDQNDPTTAGDDYTEQVVVTNDADLVTVKTLASGNATLNEGDLATFLITVTNNGAAQATNVSLTDLLPTGLTATAGNGVTSQGSYSAATGLWNVGTLDTGLSATLTLEGTVDIGQGGNTITNITTAATGDQNDPTNAGDDLDESVTAVRASVILDKSVSAIAPASSGIANNYDVTYSLVVTNNGTIDLQGFNLSDDWATQFGANFVRIVPGSVTVTDISANSLPGANLGYAGSATDSMLDGTGVLQPGQRFQVTLQVEVDPDADPGLLVNGRLLSQATVTAVDANGLGLTTSDLSDDTVDTTDVDSEGDGEPDDFTPVSISDVRLTKVIAGPPSPAVSGVTDNIDVAFGFVVTNTGSSTLSNLSLLDDLATQWGGAFVRVVPGTIVVTNIDATNAPSVNPGYDGTTASDMLLGAATDQLAAGQSFRVDVVVEVDPDSPTANRVGGQLENQATVTALDSGGTPVSDDSDNPTDSTDRDPDTDNDPDDPTVLTFARIGLEKQVISTSDAASGTEGNVDVVYRFTVSNTGITDLLNPVLVDDWFGQFGGNFVRVIPGSVNVTNISATTAPGVNNAYAGAATENMLDGAGFMAVGEQFEVTIGIEVDPDADPAALTNGALQNTATVTASDSSGLTVSDSSDDPTNPTNIDPDGDNDPDDPTGTRLPSIAVTKRATQVIAASSGTIDNFDVTYRFDITNNGSTSLTNLTLVDDWAAQFGGNFIRVLAGSVTVTNVDATSVPIANAGYSGGTQNLLAGGGLLEPGQSFQVTVDVEIDPNADPAQLTNGSLLNLATATGEDVGDPGVIVSDLSDDATQTGGGPDDPTPLQIPAIEVLKSIVGNPAPAVSGVSGNFDVTYQLVITNTGTSDLDQVQLQEDLASQFGGAFVRIASSPVITASTASDVPELNAAFDGGFTDAEIFSSLPADTSLLRANESITLQLTIEIDPDNAAANVDPVTGELENQATVRASDVPTSTPVTDDSDDPGDPSTAPNDPTPLLIPEIQLTMSIAGISQLPSGNAIVDYELVVLNSGNDTLTGLTLTDDWAGQFGGAFVSIVPSSVSVTNIDADVVPGSNGTYSGLAAENMLDGTGQLSAGQRFRVRVSVEVDPQSPTAIFVGGALQNTAFVTGQGTNSTVVSDASDDPFDVTNIDPDIDNDPDDPTVLRFSSVSVAKAATNLTPNGDFWNLEFEVIVQNSSANAITQISVIDDLATQLGPAYVSLASSPAIIASTATVTPNLNPAYDGTANTNMFDGTSGVLQAGESITLRFTAILDPDAPGAPQPLTNQVQAIALDPNGNPVSDLSDAGDDPTTTNPTDPGDTGTPDDPTLIQIGDIGLAKRVVNSQFDGADQVTVTLRLVMRNTGTVDLNNLSLVDNVAVQYGANFGSIASPPAIVGVGGGAVVPNLNAAWATDTSLDIFDGVSGLLPPGGEVTVEFDVVLLPSTGTIEVLNQAVVTGFDSNGSPATDLSDDGASPVGNNGRGGSDDPTPTRLAFFAYDSFNNFANGFGRELPSIRIASPRPPINTAYSGIAQPGSTLQLVIMDQAGQEIGWRSVVADAGGNWLAQFPNASTHSVDVHYGHTHFGRSFDGAAFHQATHQGARGGRVYSSHHAGSFGDARTFTASTLGHRLFHVPGTEIDGQPHRMEVRHTPTSQSDTGGWNVRRYFHPAVHPQLYFQEVSSVSSVMAQTTYSVLDAMHNANSNPLQLRGDQHGYELNSGSTNVSSR